MKRDLTNGSVFKNIVYFSLPYFLSYFLQTLYGMADLFIIGQFGGVAGTTAVSIGSQVMHMLTVIIVGLAMGSTVTLGRAIGAKDSGKASKSVGNTVVLFAAFSAVLTCVLLIFVRPVVSLMSTPQEAVEGAVQYLTVCFIGIPFIAAYNVISSIFRGLGDSKSPMYFIAVACVTNIGLDYLFMGAMKMGAVGAALGTTLSQAVSVVLALIFTAKKKNGISLKKSDFKPQRKDMGEILKIGVPVALQDGFIQIAFIVITIIANKRGITDAAAVGIVEKVISFIFLVPSSMLSAVSAICAQNLGAGKNDRAIKTLRYAIMTTVGFGLIVSVIVQFIAGNVVGLFTADAAVIHSGSQYLRGYVWDCLFAGIHFSFSGYFCACGKSGISFMHNVIAILTVRVPGVYLTSKMFADTLFPMGIATALGSLVSVIICVIAFAIITRKKPKQNIQTV